MNNNSETTVTNDLDKTIKEINENNILQENIIEEITDENNEEDQAVLAGQEENTNQAYQHTQNREIIVVSPVVIKDMGVGLPARIRYEKDMAEEIFSFALRYKVFPYETYPFKILLDAQMSDDRATEFTFDRYFGVTYILIKNEVSVRKSLTLALRSVKRLERYIFNRIIHENLWFEISSDKEEVNK